jgi:hypothetical protein
MGPRSSGGSATSRKEDQGENCYVLHLGLAVEIVRVATGAVYSFEEALRVWRNW